MKVRFRVNLGSDDAGRFGLDFRDCTRGAEVEVPDDVGERLIQRFCERCDTPVVEFHAVKPVEVTTSAFEGPLKRKKKPKDE